jgi:hypothetical protein
MGKQLNRNSYSVLVECEPRMTCSFNVYAPRNVFDRAPVDPATQNIDPDWRDGYGSPVIGLRGYSSALSVEEAQLALPVYLSERPAAQTRYQSHRIRSGSTLSGEASVVLNAASTFLERHELVGSAIIDAKRLGHLGMLAASGESPEGIAGSPALYIALGQLPVHAPMKA